jgi:hypothetical protein
LREGKVYLAGGGCGSADLVTYRALSVLQECEVVVYDSLVSEELLQWTRPDCEKIYDSNEEVVTDAFFALKHYASGEEDVGEDEWLYFLECLTGRREYNMEEKMSIITESLISRIKP